MGFLDNFKSLSNKSKSNSWLQLESQTDLKALNNASKEAAVIIFKHSTSCGISHSALNSFEHDWKDADKQLPVYYLDLLQYRSISNLVAKQYKVDHQSPQIIVIQNGRAVHNASHHAIKYSTAVGKIKK